MVHKAKISIILLLFYFNCFSQISPGAKDIALSHSTVALSNDVFCLFFNPSGLSQLNWREIGLYYSPSPFGMSELTNFYAVYLEPAKFGSIGIGFMNYGFELYRENEIALSFAGRFEQSLLIGITARYHTLSITRYGSTDYLTLLGGMIIYISPDLRFGFTIDNFLRESIGNEESQVPVIYSTGLSYDVLNDLSINLEVKKEIDKEVSLSFGIDYGIIDYLNLRFGFRNYPSTFSAGIGINYAKFEMDYAVFNHNDLGLTHQIGLIVHFGDDRPRRERIRTAMGFNQ